MKPIGGGREMKTHGEIVLLSILQVEARPFSTRWNNVLLHIPFSLVFSFVVFQMEPRQLPAWWSRQMFGLIQECGEYR